MPKFKSYLRTSVLIPAVLLAACSTNPATGERQFTALMSPSQENQVGASEHQKVIQQFGLVKDPALTSYVQRVGKQVTANTERPDVQYQFFVIDSPIVNAFALPGGYIYVSRGLLALANNEAELASVLGHEAGHITGRHSAERYSQSVVTSLGAGLISAALGSDVASQALGVGANLYLSSYSRSQENEADSLGLRYMAGAGYEPNAVPSFLSSLKQKSDLEARLEGRGAGEGVSYFSTHPATGERVSKTANEANAFAHSNVYKPNEHLRAIEGMIYGDSPAHGFSRGNSFYHHKIGFAFDVPNGFDINNQTAAVVATHQNGSAIIFDMGSNQQGLAPAQYITRAWLPDAPLQDMESISINGMPAATASVQGQVNGRAVLIRVVAIQWKDGFARFQMAIPKNAGGALVEDLKRTTYSFRAMSASEKANVRPYTLQLYKAAAGDTVSSIASRMAVPSAKEDEFLVLNGMQPGESIIAGRTYKIVSGG
ncbi:MAG: M48 family metalloprotease [Micavibrio sp.]|nr:M48 family metalloprotease [Micavibrio sp.]